jgi:hypothetical protein
VITFFCACCDELYAVPDVYRGRQADCLECGTPLTVPPASATGRQRVTLYHPAPDSFWSAVSRWYWEQLEHERLRTAALAERASRRAG